jgi:hypothetical protein
MSHLQSKVSKLCMHNYWSNAGISSRNFAYPWMLSVGNSHERWVWIPHEDQNSDACWSATWEEDNQVQNWCISWSSALMALFKDIRHDLWERVFRNPMTLTTMWHILQWQSLSQFAQFFLSIAGQQNMEMIQFDINMTFLHRDLDEKIYMDQPPGFVVFWVLRLRSASTWEVYMEWNRPIGNGTLSWINFWSITTLNLLLLIRACILIHSQP